MRLNNKFSWFKCTITLIIILIVTISFIPEVKAANTKQYDKLTGEEKFITIKEEVTHSALNIERYKASDIYKQLEKASNNFQKIDYLLSKANNIDNVIEQVADRFNKVANIYEGISSYASDISSSRKNEFVNLRSFRIETLKTRDNLNSEIEKIESENKSIINSLKNTFDSTERKKIEITIKGNKSIINSLDAQRMIWDKFYQTQNKILNPLKASGNNIDLLLHILNVNSKVYHEAANVALLRQSAKSALDNLQALANIEDVIIDLEDTWIEIDDIVSEISQTEFTIDVE